MYARGMSVRGIQALLLELQVSPDLISTITDEVLADVEQWQCARWNQFAILFGERFTDALN